MKTSGHRLSASSRDNSKSRSHVIIIAMPIHFYYFYLLFLLSLAADSRISDSKTDFYHAKSDINVNIHQDKSKKKRIYFHFHELLEHAAHTHRRGDVTREREKKIDAKVKGNAIRLSVLCHYRVECVCSAVAQRVSERMNAVTCCERAPLVAFRFHIFTFVRSSHRAYVLHD